MAQHLLLRLRAYCSSARVASCRRTFPGATSPILGFGIAAEALGGSGDSQSILHTSEGSALSRSIEAQRACRASITATTQNHHAQRTHGPLICDSEPSSPGLCKHPPRKLSCHSMASDVQAEEAKPVVLIRWATTASRTPPLFPTKARKSVQHHIH
ncbi:hypothetical protein L207DRAFT_98994 [Hyaloscypha variabilis F]|uniref:Uncharacterized protein n=1 Tax=Hyaloscypha variabilis (strain UAMH 11265 / GT02V1 / F) TaxID=1149755 RepID=A0A2J6RBW4_HYAVF|nr:hypothetical protein L207DRAFT_98994 [Hyaloscypha variabilis F]